MPEELFSISTSFLFGSTTKVYNGSNRQVSDDEKNLLKSFLSDYIKTHKFKEINLNSVEGKEWKLKCKKDDNTEEPLNLKFADTKFINEKPTTHLSERFQPNNAIGGSRRRRRSKRKNKSKSRRKGNKKYTKTYMRRRR